MDIKADARPEICCLFGNGVSIAVSEELKLESLTQKLMGSTSSSVKNSSEPMSRQLQNFLKQQSEIAEDSNLDFEQIIGGLDTLRSSTKILQYASEASSEDTRSSISKTITFADELYREGTQKVLKEILRASKFSTNQTNMNDLTTFIGSIINLKANSTICNLNYDALVLSAILPFHNENATYDFCDLAYTAKRADTKWIKDGLTLASELQEKFWQKKTRLVHLHGCLSFWREAPGTDTIIKTSIKTLREKDNKNTSGENYNLWDKMLKHNGPFPAVVLSDYKGKDRQIAKAPFSLGYEAFDQALRQSSHWLIAGYSFRDDSINECLRKNYIRGGKPAPRILCIDFCEGDKETALLKKLGDIFPDSKERASPKTTWLINSGIHAATEKTEWKEFAKDLV